MVVDRLEAVKGLSENKIARQIECRPVIPRGHILRPRPTIALLPQPFHKQLHVPGDQGFLLAHGAVGEAERQRASEALMLLVVGVEDGTRDAADGTGELRRLGHLAADGVTVDILPGLWVCEREVVGADAHDGAVTCVESLCVEGLAAGGVQNGPWQA